MATRSRIAFTAVKALGGLSIPQESFPESATQTYKLGACVVLAATGYLTECAADPALLVGISQRDGQNLAVSGTKETVVVLAHPLTIFRGNLDNGSGTVVSAVTDRGKNYGIAKHGATGKWYVDSTDVTAKRVIIWDFWDAVEDGTPMVVGDQLMHVTFQFGGAYFQLGTVV